MKISEFAKKIPENIDAVLISSPENRLYFTDFHSSNGYLFILKDRSIFFTDGRYIEAAKRKIKDCKLIEIEDFAKQSSKIIKKYGIKTLVTESEKTSLASFNKLKKTYSFIDFTFDIEIDNIIAKMRSVKTEEELYRIKTAQSIAEHAFDYILTFIQKGKTEREVQLELDFFMLKNGAEAIAFDTIAVSGKNSSMPHGVPSNKRLNDGDFLTLDFGAVYKGYCSDMTRTIAIGRVSADQKAVYNCVLSAQNACLGALRSGLSCFEADKIARDIIKSQGCGRFFTHSTGHSLGIEVHEAPNLSPKSEAVLSEGNVVTVEPGIYIPQSFGVRIEDMALIKKDGAENLTKSKKDLIIID